MSGLGARFALMGRLALASHEVIRATQDIDFDIGITRRELMHDASIDLNVIAIAATGGLR